LLAASSVLTLLVTLVELAQPAIKSPLIRELLFLGSVYFIGSRALPLAVFRFAASRRMPLAQAAIPSASLLVASRIIAFCSLVTGIRKSVSIRNRPFFRGRAMNMLS
jgi:hypothetical protein